MKTLCLVENVATAHRDDLKNGQTSDVSSISFFHSNTIETIFREISFENAGNNGTFIGKLPKEKLLLKRYKYTRLKCIEKRKVNGDGFGWAVSYCLTDGEPLRPCDRDDWERNSMVFITKSSVIEAWANQNGRFSLVEVWVGDDNLPRGKKILESGFVSAFHDGASGDKLLNAIKHVLGKNLEEYTKVVYHTLLKAADDMSGEPKFYAVDPSTETKTDPVEKTDPTSETIVDTTAEKTGTQTNGATRGEEDEKGGNGKPDKKTVKKVASERKKEVVPA